MDRIKCPTALLSWIWPTSQRQTAPDPEIGLLAVIDAGADIAQPQIEDYPAGYPQYSALIASYDPFFIFRSFRHLRARLTILKQNELCSLEAQLVEVDRNEPSPFFLGTCGGDRNPARAAILAQIDSKLAEYDELLDRSRRAISYSPANPRDVTSLRNWLEGSACLIKEERSYLDRGNDLVSLASPSDLATRQLEDWVEDKLIRHYKGFRKSPGFGVSSNPIVYIHSGTTIKSIATVLMLFIIAFLLLAPVIICILVDSITARVFIIITSTACYLLVLAQLTRSRMIELILAGATFATILTVFVSNSSNN